MTSSAWLAASCARLLPLPGCGKPAAHAPVWNSGAKSRSGQQAGSQPVSHYPEAIEQQFIETYGKEEGGIRFHLAAWQALAMLNDVKMTGDQPEWK